MSQPRLKSTVLDDPSDAELARWPGVTWRRERRAKHYALVLTFQGVERTVIYSGTPSDTGRGVFNHLRDLRRELKALGAERASQRKVQSAPTKARPKVVRPDFRVEPVALDRDPSRDPWAALSMITFDPPAVQVTPAVPSPIGRLGQVLRWFRATFSPTRQT